MVVNTRDRLTLYMASVFFVRTRAPDNLASLGAKNNFHSHTKFSFSIDSYDWAIVESFSFQVQLWEVHLP